MTARMEALLVSATTLPASRLRRVILATVLTAVSASLLSAQPVSNIILVDLKAGTVDGLSMRQDAKTLEAALGAERMRKTVEMLEGDPNPLLEVRFRKHLIYKHWNAFSFEDSAFRTREGLGVGSTVGDFEKVYGPGQLPREEGCAISFSDNPKSHDSHDWSWHFAIDGICTYSRAGVAEEIWVW